MSHPEEPRVQLHMRDSTNDPQQSVVSFRSYDDCSADDLQRSYETVVGRILSGRDVIVVTKGAELMDLISDAVDATDQRYVAENSHKVASYTSESTSYITNATLLRKVPLSVTKDLGSSSEFMFGNLWFLVPCGDAELERERVIEDSRKLAPSAFREVPKLWLEGLISPAMYDGLEMLWIKPDRSVYDDAVKPLFDS